ncbi:Snmp2 [Trypoxylus dichotomus]
MCTCGQVVLAVGIIGGAILVGGIVIGFTSALDRVINDQIAQSVRLKQGTEQYDRWMKLPFPLEFKVYAFNVTNPNEILVGQKPVVEEIGPFVYEEYRQKEDVIYNEETDTYTYRQRFIFHFNKELSAYPEDTVITVLNAALQGP